MNETDEILESFLKLFSFIIAERVKFLLYVDSRDEEASFPLSEVDAEREAVMQLMSEGILPPFYMDMMEDVG